MKFKNVLITSDFDGTLKNDAGIITPDVIEKIKYFISEGGYFTVCTGRVKQGFHLYNKEYINAPVILSNGSSCYDYEKQKFVFCDGIEENARYAIEHIHKTFPDMCIELYNKEKVRTINLNNDTKHHLSYQDIEFSDITNNLGEIPFPLTKMMFPAYENSDKLQAELEKFPEIHYFKTAGAWVEAVKCGIDKGVGMLKLASILGCDKKDVYAVGDGYNDVEMLTAAAKGFVPENAQREALNVATHITRSNNNGCIANVIEILDEIY